LPSSSRPWVASRSGTGSRQRGRCGEETDSRLRPLWEIEPKSGQIAEAGVAQPAGADIIGPSCRCSSSRWRSSIVRCNPPILATLDKFFTGWIAEDRQAAVGAPVGQKCPAACGPVCGKKVAPSLGGLTEQSTWPHRPMLKLSVATLSTVPLSQFAAGQRRACAAHADAVRASRSCRSDTAPASFGFAGRC